MLRIRIAIIEIIKGTLNVLQAVKELGIKRLIHTSTSEVYGTAQFVPITEEHRLLGQSPYSASKIGADQLAYSFYSSFDTPVVIVRPFNTYGPRQSSRAIIPTVITQIASGNYEINLGSVTPTRDFNYVKDIAQGFSAALRAQNGLGEVVNLGSNSEISIGDTVSVIAELMDKKIVVTTDNERVRPKNSEVERLVADNSKAKKLFGWEPKYMGTEGFKKGLTETINWFIKPENIRQYKSDIYNL
jgi:dTDP-glucose 4,6-dehydratase